MNRLILFLTAILAVSPVSACWYPTWKPGEFLTCRLDISAPDSIDYMMKEWQAMLPSVSPSLISKLIDGGYDIDHVKSLQVAPGLKMALDSNKELHQYIIVMLKTQAERRKLIDPWHYYYDGDPKLGKLDSLADISISRLAHSLGDRYAVQAARALLSLKRYNDIISIAETHRFSNPVMEKMFNQYYAGALYHMGEYEKAMPIYAGYGDYTSTEWCLKRMGRYASRLSLIAEMANTPRNYNMVVSMLQKHITQLEVESMEAYGAAEITPVEIGELINTAHSHSMRDDIYRPIWQYAEAIGHLLNHTDYIRADSVLDRINQEGLAPEMKNSVSALRFITQSQLRPYDNNYLKWIATEADRLITSEGEYSLSIEKYTNDVGDTYISRILRKTTDPQDEIPDCIDFYRNTHCSTLYFSDMLHRAADCIIVPRMLEAGDSVAALQLLDVVDYANLSDKTAIEYDHHGCASICFAMECGADIVIKAINAKHTPIATLWLKHGSIRNPSRWHDLVGTLLLSEGRYKEAAAILSKVEPDYAAARSDIDYDTDRNPFSFDGMCHDACFATESHRYYKLWFAREMSRLEDEISIGNDKDAAVKYAVAMGNSVYPCWSLTQYGRGASPFFPYENPRQTIRDARSTEIAHDFIIDDYRHNCTGINPFEQSDSRLSGLSSKARTLLIGAVENMSDKERAASILSDLGFYRTVKYHYNDTDVAETLKSKCDRWSDW